VDGVKVLFVTGFGPIVRDDASRAFYADHLGIELKEEHGYRHTETLDGVKAFALWPLSQAAESCFGTKEWPGDKPVPHAWLEFDVENIETATAALKSQGYDLITEAKVEPWGQTVTRLLSPEGILVALAVTPWLREEANTP
jgi:catechol 2,3-dioxygenase-like lactoylglutathione lyase family enzyme